MATRIENVQVSLTHDGQPVTDRMTADIVASALCGGLSDDQDPEMGACGIWFVTLRGYDAVNFEVNGYLGKEHGRCGLYGEMP